MCISSGPSTPSAPPPVVREPARRQAKLPDEGVRKAREDTRTTARRAFASRSGTLVTGAGGLSTVASTQKSTLLGQV